MKFRFLSRIFLLLLLLPGASCTKQPVAEPEPDPKPIPVPVDPDRIVLDLTVEETLEEDAQGKSTFSGNTLQWEVGDKVALWDGVAIREFTAVESEGKIVFSGEAVGGVKYWVLYPYGNCTGVDSKDPQNPVFSSSIPLSQTLRKGSVAKDAAVCIGSGTVKDGIVLKNVCGLLKFSFPSAEVGGKTLTALKPGSLDKVVIKSLGNVKLGGNISISIPDGADSVPVVNGSTSTGDDSVTLTFEECPEAGATYYVCALPGQLGGASGGIEMDFTRSGDSAVAEITGGKGSDNPLRRARVLNFGALWPKWHAAGESVSAFDTSADPSGSFDYSLLSKISHPRVMASDEDFRVLKTMLAEGSYPELNRQHQTIIDRATGLLEKTIPTIPELDALIDKDNGSYQNTFNEKLARASIDHLILCSYAYRTTGEQKFLDEVKKIIAQRNADPFWSKHPEGKSIAYLSPAEITMGMAIAYDWLYYELTEPERAAIRSSITTKPFEQGENKVKTSWLYNEVNNRGQVHNSGIMATALAMYDYDKAFANKWMEYSYDGIHHIVEGIYGTTGSTQEGYGYWEYGTSFQTCYNEMLRTVFGNDSGLSDNVGFTRTADYNLYMSDHIAPFAFSDGGRDNLSCGVAPWWLACRYQRPEILNTVMYLQGIGRKVASRIAPIITFSLSKYPKLDLSGISRPSSDVWVDTNESVTPVVLVRTGWTCTDGDKYLGLKGGYASVSHGHMDVGTFEYHARGERWSVDNSVGGYAHYTNKNLSGSGQTATSGYVKWLALAYNSLGHSTMSFANYDSTAGGIKKTHNTDHIVAATSKATILETYNTTSEKGGKIDMTKTLKGQVKSASRKAVIKDGAYLLVEDRIEALSNQDGKMIWRMITPPGVVAEIIGGKSIKLSQNGKTMYLHPEFSGNVTNLQLRNWGAFDAAHPGKTGEWGWTASDYKVSEVIKANVVGFTVTIPKGTTVTVSTTLTEYDPAADIQGGVGGETPGFDNGEQYNW